MSVGMYFTQYMIVSGLFLLACYGLYVTMRELIGLAMVQVEDHKREQEQLRRDNRERVRDNSRNRVA